MEISFKHFEDYDRSRYSYCHFAPVKDEVAGPVCCDLHPADLLDVLEVADSFIYQIAHNSGDDDGVRHGCKEDNSSSLGAFHHAFCFVSKRVSCAANFELKIRITCGNFQN